MHVVEVVDVVHGGAPYCDVWVWIRETDEKGRKKRESEGGGRWEMGDVALVCLLLLAEVVRGRREREVKIIIRK